MGILKEMFDESGDELPKREPVKLALGTYKNTAENVLRGYKIFQKKYVYKSLALKLFLVLAASASSVLMLVSPENGDYTLPAMCLLACVVIGIYFISEPINNRKKVVKAVGQTDDAEYTAEITDMTIKISTNKLPEAETEDNEAAEDNQSNDGSDEEQNDENTNSDDIPATVIHLDSSIVDIFDTDGLYVVCVKKSYVFIIPKAAFTEDENKAVKEKLSLMLDYRYKTV